MEISEFIPLYDLEDNETGYYLTFSKDGAAAGYILLSLLTTGSPVVEFSFDGSGPLDTHTNVSQGATASEAAPSGKFIYVGPDSLFMPMNNGTYYSVYDRDCVDNYTVQEILDETQARLDDSGDATTMGIGGDVYDGIIDWSEQILTLPPYIKLETLARELIIG